MLWRATSRPSFPEWLSREYKPSDLDRTEGWYPNPIKRPPQREHHTPNQPPYPNRRPNRHGRRAPPALSGSVCAAATVFEVSRSRGEPWFLHSPMAPRSPWWAVLLLLVLLATATAAAAAPPPEACLVPTSVESILGHPGTCSLLDRRLGDPVGVIEGDEATLARAVNLLHMNKDDYIAVLFYASWCPFSQECKPNFETLAYLFPTIRHFAFEESAIRPSIISRYGIHGFPTLFLLNSTMRVRYHGPRTVKPLAAFYTDVSGINASVKSTVGEGMVHLDEFEPKKDTEQENCPFWWARSPENILQQDTYLALATSFVILRLLYLLFPKIGSFAKRVWRHTIFAYLMGVHEYFFTYLEQSRQKFNRLYPSKGGNLQEGARTATAWASKSFVSIGEPSTIGRTNSTNELR